mmetsp:Transcript_19672/g.35443  ORF Transcript_19672/g.35443 Transcript_19672/m.35443 type:complete len:259 (-) Transcript_19672:46-822(-)
MLNTSFTLRPSSDEKDRVELTFRPRTVVVNRVSFVGSLRKQQHCQEERALKRQRLFVDRSLYPSKRDGRRAATATFIEEPSKIRRIPIEFEPPSDEAYWKRRCFRMQAICKETRSRMREMEEDQRQLRRRIQELETQLLLQSDASLTKTNTTTAEDDGEDEEGLGSSTKRQGEPQREDGDMRRETTTTTTTPPDRSSNRTPPAILAIPNVPSTSSCFYLTDGEGLSDSELHEEEDMDEHLDDDDEDEEDRNDQSPRRG